jgi:hypothetical protein
MLFLRSPGILPDGSRTSIFSGLSKSAFAKAVLIADTAF